eukprot:CAMPEP_0204897514 /NCGR_PEP_ID=MMETSP1397-20131031/784_1 /ASSEMBLY_ACC=CAM_ASM_000891 /TAXON_ID=49980 /ORGANISM="Climacostomum Climacostomum virens, Strain Stock W-24" /LENGTH=866 /DNA_ID=CAMNT_0052065281 /DNA_START=151 /DNA_END=2751 /DNA_ORIENTATION=-
MWRLGNFLAKHSRHRLYSTSQASSLSTKLRALYGLDINPSEPTQGLVFRHLPKHFDIPQLNATFSSLLGVDPTSISTYTDIEGKPVYSVVQTEDQRVIEKGLAFHKQQFEGAKVRVSTIEAFLNENKPLSGGFDSRKVVVLNLPCTYTEEDVVRRLQLAGNIMGVYIPKDYEAEPLSKLGFSPYDANLVELEEISDPYSETQSSHSVVVEASRSIKKKADAIQATLDNGSELVQASKDVRELWDYVAVLLKRLNSEPTESLTEISSKLSELESEQDPDKLRKGLGGLTWLTYQEGNKALEPHLRNKGFAIVTFATKEQAARAVTGGSSIFDFKSTLAFYRNQPEYALNAKAFREAYMRRLMTKGDNENDHTKLLGMLNMAIARVNNNINSERIRKQYFGEDGSQDPVFEGKLKSKAEEVKLRLELDDMRLNSGLVKELKIREDSQYRLGHSLFSSDEELFDLDAETSRPGRVSDPKTQLDILLNMKRSWIDPDFEEEGFKYEDFLRANPKKLYWSPISVEARLTEKDQGLKNISEAEKFFRTAIPSKLKGHPELLSKARFGDGPEERYIYKVDNQIEALPTEDTSLDDPQTNHLRSLVDRLFNDKKDTPVLIENQQKCFLEDEEYFYATNYDLKFYSDTDEDTDYKLSIPDDLRFRPDMTEEDLKEMRAKVMDAILYFKAQMNPAVVESYNFKGPDIEDHVKEVKAKFPPDVKVEWRKIESGDKVVVISYAKKWKYDLAEVEYLNNKYGEKLNSSELEVDAEDLELVQKIFSGFDRKEFENEVEWQLQARHYSEKISFAKDIEKVRNYGDLHYLMNSDDDNRLDSEEESGEEKPREDRDEEEEFLDEEYEKKQRKSDDEGVEDLER